MISYKGNLSITVAIPVFAQLLGALDIPGLQAEAAALLQATVTFTPPSLLGVAAVMAAISAAISAGFQPPAVDFKGLLLVKLGLLKARLELLLKIKDLLAGGSVRVYEYDGAAGDFGAELGATLAGPEASGGVAPARGTFAVVLLAEGGTAGETTLKILRSGA